MDQSYHFKNRTYVDDIYYPHPHFCHRQHIQNFLHEYPQVFPFVCECCSLEIFFFVDAVNVFLIVISVYLNKSERKNYQYNYCSVNIHQNCSCSIITSLSYLSSWFQINPIGSKLLIDYHPQKLNEISENNSVIVIAYVDLTLMYELFTTNYYRFQSYFHKINCSVDYKELTNHWIHLNFNITNCDYYFALIVKYLHGMNLNHSL